jgi:tetratricopeptide (TPR) repeat protein
MKKKKQKQKAAAGFSPPDRRAMEKTLADLHRFLEAQEFDSIDEANALLSQLGGQVPERDREATPLELAQDKMYEAFEASGKKRTKLAREALSVCADCVDAYVLLAEEASANVEQAKEWFEQGVKAGERTLGPDFFKESRGHFWGLLETRPYMRAREGLAQCLWEMGERGEAIKHFREMLALNPNDNQGVRYELAHLFLLEGLDQELGELFNQYPEDPSAVWAYSKALCKFRREGDSLKSRLALSQAFRCNLYVPLYFGGVLDLPDTLPLTVGFGDESEAEAYVLDAFPEWSETPGALEWLAKVFVEETEKIIRKEEQASKSWILQG